MVVEEGGMEEEDGTVVEAGTMVGGEAAITADMWAGRFSTTAPPTAIHTMTATHTTATCLHMALSPSVDTVGADAGGITTTAAVRPCTI